MENNDERIPSNGVVKVAHLAFGIIWGFLQVDLGNFDHRTRLLSDNRGKCRWIRRVGKYMILCRGCVFWTELHWSDEDDSREMIDQRVEPRQHY